MDGGAAVLSICMRFVPVLTLLCVGDAEGACRGLRRGDTDGVADFDPARLVTRLPLVPPTSGLPSTDTGTVPRPEARLRKSRFEPEASCGRGEGRDPLAAALVPRPSPTLIPAVERSARPAKGDPPPAIGDADEATRNVGVKGDDIMTDEAAMGSGEADAFAYASRLNEEEDVKGVERPTCTGGGGWMPLDLRTGVAAAARSGVRGAPPLRAPEEARVWPFESEAAMRGEESAAIGAGGAFASTAAKGCAASGEASIGGSIELDL